MLRLIRLLIITGKVLQIIIYYAISYTCIKSTIWMIASDWYRMLNQTPLIATFLNENQSDNGLHVWKSKKVKRGYAIRCKKLVGHFSFFGWKYFRIGFPRLEDIIQITQRDHATEIMRHFESISSGCNVLRPLLLAWIKLCTDKSSQPSKMFILPIPYNECDY